MIRQPDVDLGGLNTYNAGVIAARQEYRVLPTVTGRRAPDDNRNKPCPKCGAKTRRRDMCATCKRGTNA